MQLAISLSNNDYRNDTLYSPQMVVAANTTKYTIENDLTKKRKKEKKQTNTQTKWHVLI